jgi:hypothetical protein
MPTADTLRWEATLTGDDPDQQVADTIDLMRRYVQEDYATPDVKEEAVLAVLYGSNPLDGIFYHVKRMIRFQPDEMTSNLAKGLGGAIPVVEVLIRPRDMVTFPVDTGGMGRVGDCDDYAMLTAALLKARGIDCSFVTVAADPRVPGQYSHVYVAAYPKDGGRVPMDTSHGAAPGWEVEENVTRREEWPIDTGLGKWLAMALVALALVSNWWTKQRKAGRRVAT